MLLGDEDFERFRFHVLTYGLVPAPTWYMQSEGAIFAARGIVRDALIAIALEAGVHISSDLLAGVPTAKCRSTVKNIRRALDTKQLSADAISAWGRAQRLLGRLEMIRIQDEVTGATVEQIIAGQMHSVDMHHNWFAKWVRANAESFEPNDRAEAGQELAAVCREVNRGTLPPLGAIPT